MPIDPAQGSPERILNYAPVPYTDKLWRRLVRLLGAVLFFCGLLLSGIMFLWLISGQEPGQSIWLLVSAVVGGMMFTGGVLIWLARKPKVVK